jgi:hypothetical protein
MTKFEQVRSLVTHNLINELRKNPVVLERFAVENLCEFALRDTRLDGPITDAQLEAGHQLLSILELMNSSYLIEMNMIMSRLRPGHKKAWTTLISESVWTFLNNKVYTDLLERSLEAVINTSKQQLENNGYSKNSKSITRI